MIKFAFVLSLLAAGVAHAGSPALPIGSFGGTATWRGPGGTTGTYAVEKTITGNTVVTHYSWKEPKPRDERATMTLAIKGADPNFEVQDEKGNVIGKGCIYDQVCTYHAVYGPITIDETYRWSGNTLDVVGGKSGPGFSVAWNEVLKTNYVR